MNMVDCQAFINHSTQIFHISGIAQIILINHHPTSSSL